ncbi:nitric oxide synthase, salivary gland-like [Schistocerca cancellata]|uniref:nitric oxide synthase, salivary gland-like n=1 Tax=Schistocerca cancellata TaxID=274614 RepID=UPI002119A132|nr:nitric oxide synthase, salivary gland-like [Schistocerca cancellata]
MAMLGNFVRLRNHATKETDVDRLHTNVSGRQQNTDFFSYILFQPSQCGQKACLGSVVALPGGDAKALRTREDILKHANDFLEQYYSSMRRADSQEYRTRLEKVQHEVAATGTYWLTSDELAYGAKLAWRNSVRCIGRIQWANLQVFDCRHVTTAKGMFEAVCKHIEFSTNNGNIKSAITVFPQRTDGKHDYRVWNSQLINFAGYKNEDGSVTGDPANMEFTEVCLKLGWKSPRTNFDVLPLVLSANGEDPEIFDIPPELVLRVPLSHPTYDWFKELGLQWFALPAVSGMMFDCGGIEFTAAPFNGWYMSTEIGCRNLCDAHRYNMLETVATRMGLDTRTAVTLWKDKALVEVNVAVLHSFQLKSVTIVDHHTASESFMKHYKNEMRLRKGCPADWVWIVPPISGSVCPVYHQEMAMYLLKPSYDYQDPAWKSHVWKSCAYNRIMSKPSRRFNFKQIARVALFSSKLFVRVLSARIKATILYATETGRSETFAKKLGDIFGHVFNVQVCCMDDYDMNNIEQETLILIVTSTFGNGDPPENGKRFIHDLCAMKKMEDISENSTNKEIYECSDTFRMAISRSLIGVNDCTDMDMLDEGKTSTTGIDSPRGSSDDSGVLSESSAAGPLSSVRFAVFALGSRAYPNFCAFGKYVDNILGELGGERIADVCKADELCGQEQTFRKWAANIFTLACEAFCIDADETLLKVTKSLTTATLSATTVRFVHAKEDNLLKALSAFHNKQASVCRLIKKTNLHHEDVSHTTILLQLKTDLTYLPGDHVAVFPCNRPAVVNGILERIHFQHDPDQPVELQMLNEAYTSNGALEMWKPARHLPHCSLRTLLTRFLDITTPPTPELLQHFASIATNAEDQQNLILLAKEPAAYEKWRQWRFPHLLEVLEQFPSVHPSAAVLAAHLDPLQPRFYSISSSPDVYQKEMHITAAVVVYRTQGGGGPLHFGVCSNYLHDIGKDDEIYAYVRSAPNFHMPKENTKPVIMVGPGTGIAPFRGFWQQRMAELQASQKGPENFGKMWLFFGCRHRSLDLYREEKTRLVEDGVLDKVYLALSREANVPKTYVQDLLRKEAFEIYKKVMDEDCHFYVCGDCTMAEDVYQTMKKIIQQHSTMTDGEIENYMMKMRDENRYHEDIFGITVSTAEVRNRSRVTSRVHIGAQP